MAYHIGKNCKGCTACVRLCPVSAISGERLTQHVINEKRCVQCGVCGRTCRYGAVTDGSGKACAPVSRTLWSKPVIDSQRCTACGLCVSVCSAQALRIAPPARRGDIVASAELYEPAKCVGCSLCSLECPLHIITMKGVGVS